VAEERARREHARGSGTREVTLLKLLTAYEEVGGVSKGEAGGSAQSKQHPQRSGLYCDDLQLRVVS